MKNKIDPYQVRKKSSRFIGKFLRYLFLTGMAFILLYPLIYMISMAFRTMDDIYDPTVIWIPKHFTFGNLKYAAKLLDYPKTIMKTIVISLGSTVFLMISTSLAGYGFARFHFKGKSFLFGCVILSIIVPPETILIPMYLEYRYFDFFAIGKLIGMIAGKPFETNLLDTIWTMYLPAIFANGIRAGLLIYIFRQFFRGLPVDLEDAACVDGCGPVRTFLSIMVPSSTASYITVFLFSFIWYWNDYYYANMYMPTGKTLSLALSMMSTKFPSSIDSFTVLAYMQAGALLTVLPPLLIYIFFQRYFTESIARVGIVG